MSDLSNDQIIRSLRALAEMDTATGNEHPADHICSFAADRIGLYAAREVGLLRVVIRHIHEMADETELLEHLVLHFPQEYNLLLQRLLHDVQHEDEDDS